MLIPTVRVAVGVLLFVLLASPALGQTRVRVTADRANIWRPNFLTVATVVEEGTVLEVIARRGEWLEVVVPGGSASDRRTGLVSIRQVTPVGGSLPADSGPVQPTTPTLSAGAQRLPPRPVLPPDTGLRGFADASYNWFTARDSFDAILEKSSAPFVGGGVEFRARNRMFAQAAIRWFRATGERAFVDGGEVFRLGIPDRVTIVPVSFSAGYRLPARQTIPYIGGGVGTYLFKEASDFAIPSENVDRHFPSYHILGGVEWRRTGSLIAAAFEGQYTFVPNSLSGQVAEAFEEDDLGGLEVRFKIVIGR
jgi:hypothetical protein